MFLSVLITIILFYFFAILQSSFFIHFNFSGAVPNLVFIFFFLIVYFSSQKIDYKIFVYATVAGLFLDIFSYTYFAVHVVLLIIIGLGAKKIQASFKEKKDKYPFIYFLPLFLLCLLAYELLLGLYSGFNFEFLGEIVYNLFVASIGFFIFKKFKIFSR